MSRMTNIWLIAVVFALLSCEQAVTMDPQSATNRTGATETVEETTVTKTSATLPAGEKGSVETLGAGVSIKKGAFGSKVDVAVAEAAVPAAAKAFTTVSKAQSIKITDANGNVVTDIDEPLEIALKEVTNTNKKDLWVFFVEADGKKSLALHPKVSGNTVTAKFSGTDFTAVVMEALSAVPSDIDYLIDENGEKKAVTTSTTTTASGSTTTSSASTTTTATTTTTTTPTPTPAVPGITVTTTTLTTTEAGGTVTFTVKLDTAPTANVSVALSSSDTTEGTVSPASLTFTSSNYSTAQTVTVTGVDDSTNDGNISYSVVIAAAVSTDSNYSGINPTDLTLSNTDDDIPGFTVSSISGNTTEASAGTATFTVRLNLAPTANVVIGITSSDTTEGTVSPSSLTFTTGNWNTPQTVTVTGVDDYLDDADVSYSIVTAAATSSDTSYNGLNPSDVTVVNIDNDTLGFTVSAISGNTTEAGGTATFTVSLGSQPSANVSFGITSSNTAEGTVSPSSLTFTSGNWSTAQTVTVTGVDDNVIDGTVAYSIVNAAATSSDSSYNGVNPSDVSVSNTDNDTAGFTISAASGSTTEAGGTATFTVKLASQPTANVSIGLTSSDTTEGTVSPSSLTFTSANWNTNQTVTVTGVDDSDADGDVSFSIVTAAATSSDSNYNAVNPSDVSITNTDDESSVQYSLSFDGSNDYVTASDTGYPTGTQARSIAMWLKPTTVNNQYHAAFYYGNYSGTNMFSVGVSDGNGFFISQHGSVIAGGTAQANTWAHLCVTYDGSLYRIYVNGTEVTNGAMSTNTTLGGTVMIGKDPGTLFAGLIDDVRFYSKALSAAEVTGIYGNGEGSISNVDSSGTTISGLVNWWKFDAGTGTTAADSAGSNSGTLTNGPVWKYDAMPGKRSLQFDGSNDYVNISSPTNLSNSNVTVSVWVKLAATQSSKVFFARYKNTSGIALGISDSSSNVVKWFTATDGGSTDTIQSTTALTNNIWYHVVGTFDGTTKRLYINGVQEATSTWSNAIGYTSVYTSIGALLTPNVEQVFNGHIDDVRVYSQALSAGDISSLYNSGAGLATNSISGLVGWWKLNGSGTIAKDSSTNANHGTLTNGPTWDGRTGRTDPLAGITPLASVTRLWVNDGESGDVRAGGAGFYSPNPALTVDHASGGSALLYSSRSLTDLFDLTCTVSGVTYSTRFSINDKGPTYDDSYLRIDTHIESSKSAFTTGCLNSNVTINVY